MTDAAPHRYATFGLAIASELALPELTPAAADERVGPPDLVIRLAALPGGAPPRAPRCERRDAAFEVRGVGRFRVRGGAEIAIDPAPRASEAGVRGILLGSALGLVCHQRGLLPLHASTIVAGGRAAAFAGPSGSGKSTLAAHFDGLGRDVLGDDICAVALRGDVPWVLPGPRHVKLTPETATQLGHAPAELRVAGAGSEKRILPLGGSAGSAPLSRLYVLNQTPADRFSISRLSGTAAVEALMANIFRRASVDPMGLTAGVFALSTAVARRVGVFGAARTLDLAVFESEADALLRHVEAALEGAPA